ncbi:MAG: hypothetical protein IT162_21715 [Bryobacterales bacterium]|nr:hypothetical protein [Bryobacterales bacterium]
MTTDPIRRHAPAAAVWLAMLWVSAAAALSVLAVAAVVYLRTRQWELSLALGAALFPVGVWLIDHPGVGWVAAAAVLAAFLVWWYRDGFVMDVKK